MHIFGIVMSTGGTKGEGKGVGRRGRAGGGAMDAVVGLGKGFSW